MVAEPPVTTPPLLAVAVSVPPKPVTTLPAASTTLTTGCVPRMVPAPALAAGGVVSWSAAAAPGVSAMLPLVTLGVPVRVAERVYAPTLSSVTLAKVATPAMAATLIVPPRTPGPLASDSVMVSVALVTRLSAASLISTARPNGASETALDGGAARKATVAGMPAAMLNGSVTMVPKPTPEAVSL